MTPQSIPPRLNDEKIASFLKELKVIHENSHFVYTSQRHGSKYIDKDAIGRNPMVLSAFAYELACRLCLEGPEGPIETGPNGKNIVAVVGAPMGAISLSNWVAFYMNEFFPRQGKNVGIIEAIYADKVNGELIIKRGFEKVLQQGNCFIIEDIINTAKSARQLISAVRNAGGNPVGVGAICNRGDATTSYLGLSMLKSLLSIKFDSYAESDIPAWLRAIPVRTDLGHGADYVRRIPARN